MLSDILESTKQSLLERLSNPLVSSFCISWCLWNWKFLVILFSDATVTQTFHLVSTVAFPNLWSCLIQGILLPLVSSVIYIFVLPYPSQFIYAFTLKRQREANEVKQKIQDETLLSVEESTLLKEEFREYERQSKEKINALNDEIAKLSAVREKTKPTKKALTALKVDSFKPSEVQVEILRFVSQAKDFILQEEIILALKRPRVKTEYEVGELVKTGLLKDAYDSYGDIKVALTQDGRRVLLESLGEA
jgi:hypothetical protein